MFDNLEPVDWNKFGEPDLQQWLIDLSSDDRQTRGAAYGKLVDRLIPWPAFDEGYGNPELFKFALRDDVPLLAVPFLIALFTYENLRRNDVLGLLHDLACYVYAAQVFTRINDPEDIVYRARARLIREAVRSGIPVYQAFLSLPDSAYDSEDMELKRGAKDILRILETENEKDL